jgi:Flp pilus assembly protein CpaB
MVALAVPINEISGVGGALRIGDKVDILVSLNILEYDEFGNESMPEYSAQLTLQDIEILHLGSWAPPMPGETTEEGASSGIMGSGGGREGGSTCEPLNIAILLVERQDALVLKYAMDTKEQEAREAFTMILRGVEDEQRYTTEAVNQDYMVQRFKFARPPFIIRDEID